MPTTKTKQPAPPALNPRSLPGPETITRRELGNGIVVLVFENHTSPSVVVDADLRAGALWESRAQAGLAGSSILEKNVLLAGQVGVSGHLTVHDNAVVYAQSGIGGDVAPGAVISGSPAFDAGDWRRAVTAFPRLPELLKTVRDLRKRVEQLEGAARPEER